MSNKETSESPMVKEREPFSSEKLNLIFQIDPDKPNHLLKKETNHIEYKQSFHYESFDTHARTFAALANTEGGYLVFGVVDETRELLGLLDDRFEKLDPRIPTEFLNSRFSPEIQWASYTHKIGENEFGLIYVWPSDNKPVIAKTNGIRINEGQIFYRYRGSTENIKYPELQQIFADYRRKEQELWLRHLKRLATIGVENAAIFNPIDGTVTGKGGTFIIDASLLPNLQFIREGEFKESEGSPAIRLVGDAEILAAGAIAATETKLKPTLIRTPQIIEAFIRRIKVMSPTEYIKAACYESSPYIPIYYYAYLSNISCENMIVLINQTKGPSKHTLLNKIDEDDSHIKYYSLPKSEEAVNKRLVLKDLIINAELNINRDVNPVNLFEAIQLLQKEEINQDYLFTILVDIYNMYWNDQPIIRTFLRKAICHIDYVLFKNELVENGG